MRACRPMWYMCQRASMPVPFKCQRTRSMSTFHLYVLTCEPAIRPTNMPNGMPIFQLGMPTCQKMCLFFKHSSYEMLKEISILYYWMLSVSPTASYEITLIRLSVCLSCRQSQSFLKIGSLFFSDVIHDDSWLRYLVTDGARFLKKKKKFWRPEFMPNGSKSCLKLGFLSFSQVWFICFPWNCIQW